MSNMTIPGIQGKIAKGWKPNAYLTNMSVAYHQADSMYVAEKIFPVCPVDTSIGNYYIFNKGDLARDHVDRKPMYGKVAPTVFATGEDTYKCEVDQIITGIDQISTLNYQRAKTPGMSDPRRAKVRFITEQIKLHRDVQFAQGFFKAGVWANEYTGVASSPTGKQSLKFNDGNFDPVNFFNARKREILVQARRPANTLALGVDAFNALCEHGDIIERVKYSGSTANPATVNERVLGELFGIEKVVVLESTYNKAGIGKTNMDFVCDPGAALLAYVNQNPAIDEPSAGYVFAWDMLGDGRTIAIDQFDGEDGTHTEFVEGLTCATMKKVCDDCAIFMSSMV